MPDDDALRSDPAGPSAVLEAVPTGSRLVHVGFYKSGTTALQSRMTRSQPWLAEHGVRWPAPADEQRLAAFAVAGRSAGWRGADADPPPIAAWESLVSAVRDVPDDDRVFLSSEFLADVAPDVIARIVGDLGGPGRVHVLATVRPLARVLPSAWQQNLKNGLPQPYDRWLRQVISPGTRDSGTSFWSRHDYPTILARWVEAVGADHVCVVMTDSQRPTLLFDAVSRLLGLPLGGLAPDPDDKSNRSLSPGEAELLLQVNRALREADYAWSDYRDLVRYGLVERMVERAVPADAGIPLPGWAHEPCRELAESLASRLDSLGIRVEGDLAQLAALPPSSDDPAAPQALPLDSAVQAVLGTLSRAVSDNVDLDLSSRRKAAAAPGLRTRARRLLRRS